ncbi:hypothetical protein BJ508DRAFT_412927 [Ascobolus immersus RN42]|uniref:Uncharacterized protein n=1 Tax=Ascobolus immersus RN42 TaxID=1160509 RepID=A0A3N4IF56_ASCIM|nr:hypothetical protein BJ508DRAFT_412927 [Ascobolus immersus RN42]
MPILSFWKRVRFIQRQLTNSCSLRVVFSALSMMATVVVPGQLGTSIVDCRVVFRRFDPPPSHPVFRQSSAHTAPYGTVSHPRHCPNVDFIGNFGSLMAGDNGVLSAVVPDNFTETSERIAQCQSGWPNQSPLVDEIQLFPSETQCPQLGPISQALNSFRIES